MSTPNSIEAAYRKDGHFHYTRVDTFNAWGEKVCHWKFKKWL